jgi:hypothetical protein
MGTVMYKFYEIWTDKERINRFDATHTSMEVVDGWIAEYFDRQPEKVRRWLRITVQTVYVTQY